MSPECINGEVEALSNGTGRFLYYLSHHNEGEINLIWFDIHIHCAIPLGRGIAHACGAYLYVVVFFLSVWGGGEGHMAEVLHTTDQAVCGACNGIQDNGGATQLERAIITHK